jgi:UDP-galactopyranose mutase
MYVWDYFEKFIKLRELKHYTLTYIGDEDKFYTYPIHADEIKEMPDYDKICNELSNKTVPSKAKNFEDYWTATIGETLYNKFIHKYSEKMWQIKNNKELDEFKFSPKGTPLKTGSKQCFEGVKVIAYPEDYNGYNSYFEKCTEDCDVFFNSHVSVFDIFKKRIKTGDKWFYGDIIINTASIDSLFDYCFGELRYIGREFLKIILPIEKLFPDEYVFVHYANDEPFTRIVEYKKLTGYTSPNTLIILEFPSFKNKLYPYPIKSEISKAKKYLDLLPDYCISLGRAGQYKYDNMDMIVKDCMEIFKQL